MFYDVAATSHTTSLIMSTFLQGIVIITNNFTSLIGKG